MGPRLRDLRQYLLDKCDFAGVLDVDLATVAHFIGSPVSNDDINTALRGRGVWIKPDRLFIPDFVEFQYGDLKEESRPHLSVIKTLQRHSIDPKKLTLCKGYRKGIHTLKDKDKDKDQVKDKEKERLFESLDSLLANLPQKTKDGWASLYKQDFIDRQLILAWNYYETKPPPKRLADWSRALGSWLERGHQWEKKNNRNQAPDTGGWEHIDGVS